MNGNSQIFEVNKNYLSQNLYNMLLNIKPADLVFKDSKDHHIVPIHNNNSLHSSYYPLKEGKQIADNLQLQEGQICIAIGFGAGYHLIKLAENTQEKIIVVCFLHSVLKAILQKIDLSTLFDENKIILILPDEINNYFNYTKYSGYKFVIHKVYERLYSHKILELIQMIKQNLNSNIVEHNTRIKFSKLWFNNILRNVAALYNSEFDFSPLIVKKNIVLVVGAGPSLEQNIAIIRKYKIHFYIAAADTALKVLLKNQIIPDVVFSFDSQHHSILNFVGATQNIRLFTDFLSPLRNIPRRGLMFSNHPIFNVFEECGWELVRLDSTSRNIGHSIIDFFNDYFKYLTVLSVGIDYAFFQNNGYSQGTYLDEYKLNSSSYYKPIDMMDAKLFYRSNFIKNNNNWKTTMLFNTYANNSNLNKEVFTLSSSPFTPYKKIDSLNDFIADNSKDVNMVINFNYPLPSKDDFIKTFIKVVENKKIFNSSLINVTTKELKNILSNLIK